MAAVDVVSQSGCLGQEQDNREHMPGFIVVQMCDYVRESCSPGLGDLAHLGSSCYVGNFHQLLQDKWKKLLWDTFPCGIPANSLA